MVRMLFRTEESVDRIDFGRAFAIGVLLSFALMGVSTDAAADDWEPLAVRPASDLQPAEVLKGEHHTVGDAVETDGFMNFYDLQTDFGPFSADSDWELQIRLAEVSAMAELAKVTKSKAFTDALGSAALAPVDTAKDLVDDPGGTLKSVGKGVGNLFKRSKRIAKEATAKKEEKADSGEAADATAGEEEGAGQEEAEGESGAKKKGVADQALGTDKQVRLWAYKLRIDPYTDNEALAGELDRVARASAAGGGSLKLRTFDQIEGGLPNVSKDIYVLNVKDLRARNEKILTDAGFTAESLDAFAPFFDSPHLSPTMRTILLDRFVELEGVEGREQLIAMAAAMETVDEARFQVGHAEFLAAFHGQNELESIEGGITIPAALTRQGETMLVIAADHVGWTEPLAIGLQVRLDRLKEATGDEMIDLYVAGDATPRAVEGLAGMGVRVQTSEF